uniref:Phosphotransferase n=1 Tax=Streptomyces sp. NBC_01401 TaxID=2903854 RepID=A0AAU3H668_9ACTN
MSTCTGSPDRSHVHGGGRPGACPAGPGTPAHQGVPPLPPDLQPRITPIRWHRLLAVIVGQQGAHQPQQPGQRGRATPSGEHLTHRRLRHRLPLPAHLPATYKDPLGPLTINNTPAGRTPRSGNHPGAYPFLVDRGPVSAVIDFGDVTSGDPAADLSVAWTLFTAEQRAAALRQAYGSNGRRPGGSADQGLIHRRIEALHCGCGACGSPAGLSTPGWCA